ncbi:MAG: stage V sporulation protein AA [Lachnospiraceae bacterium]|nr:stage V sporulation protein AA [Lachnospiraceae bacterium]
MAGDRAFKLSGHCAGAGEGGSSVSDTLYLKFEKNMAVRTKTVTLGDVADMECSNSSIVNKLKPMKLFAFQNIKKGSHTCAARQICSVVEVVQKIHQICPELEIQNMGETDFIVEYSTKDKDAPIVLFLKISIVCLVTFFGSVFSIMAFNNDVSTTKLFAQLYEMVTGEASNGFTILELTYSLGLSVGIVAFFNHLGGRRLTKDPTPIEVEMRQYEDDVDTTLIMTAGRNGMHKKESQTN